MSLPLSPRTRLSLTKPLDDEILNALLAYEEWRHGETDILATTADLIAASQTGVTLETFEPPVDNREEWTPLAIAVRDSNNVDVADLIYAQYLDSVAGVAINWAFPTTGAGIGSIQGTWWMWPTEGTKVTTFDHVEFRLRRRDNKEGWKRLAVLVTTTATVGNRSFVVFFYYKRRRL